MRAFTQGGYADLHQVHAWNQDFVRESEAGVRYERIAREIDNALAFMKACGADPEEFRRVDFYASHEALVLDYERPLVRIDSRTGNPYSVSGHFLWIGERTRDPRSAHMHFASLIHNPIGVKLGPTATPEDALALAQMLNPRADSRAADLHHPHGGRARLPMRCPRSSKRWKRTVTRWCGSAIRCTATPVRPAVG